MRIAARPFLGSLVLASKRRSGATATATADRRPRGRSFDAHRTAPGRRPGEVRLMAAAVPLALAPVAATLVFAEQSGVDPTGTALVHALGMAAIVLIDPLVLRRMVARVGAGLLAGAFVADATALALSVIADFPLGWQRIPVGLYRVDDLALPHFHSLCVQTLFETDAPGLMALAAWFGCLLLAQSGPWRAAAGATLVGFLATQAFDLAWHHASVAVSVLLVAVLGLAPRMPEAAPESASEVMPEAAPGSAPEAAADGA